MIVVRQALQLLLFYNFSIWSYSAFIQLRDKPENTGRGFAGGKGGKKHMDLTTVILTASFY